MGPGIRQAFIIGLCLSSLLFAAEPVATITATPNAGVLVNGRPLQTAGAPNWPLAKNDQIATSQAGAVIAFPDRASVTLGADTRVIVHKCAFCVVAILQGSLTYNIPANAKLEICALNQHPVLPAGPAEGAISVEAPDKIVVTAGGQPLPTPEGKCDCTGSKAPIIWAVAGGGAAAVAGSTIAIITASSK